jgi:hypothetical protein
VADKVNVFSTAHRTIELVAEVQGRITESSICTEAINEWGKLERETKMKNLELADMIRERQSSSREESSNRGQPQRNGKAQPRASYGYGSC